jgi:hypothetical protein
MQLVCIVLMIGILGTPVHAQENLLFNDVTKQLISQPYFTNISIFQTGFDISTTGKASVNVYLTAQNVDSVMVEASLQQYKNGAWTTIISWSNTEAGTNAGLSGKYYVSKGFSYRIISYGYVYQAGKVVETSVFCWYITPLYHVSY